MNTFLKLILVVTVMSSGVNASWFRRNKSWIIPVAGTLLLGRDVGADDYANLEKSLGFKPESKKFRQLFKIVDEDENGKLDAAELKHLKKLIHVMKQLEKISEDDS